MDSQWNSIFTGVHDVGSGGPSRTISRAESTATLWLAKYTEGSLDLGLASQYVAHGLLKGPARPCITNGGLRGQTWASMATRGAIMHFKAQSHMDAQRAAGGPSGGGQQTVAEASHRARLQAISSIFRGSTGR